MQKEVLLVELVPRSRILWAFLTPAEATTLLQGSHFLNYWLISKVLYNPHSSQASYYAIVDMNSLRPQP